MNASSAIASHHKSDDFAVTWLRSWLALLPMHLIRKWVRPFCSFSLPEWICNACGWNCWSPQCASMSHIMPSYLLVHILYIDIDTIVQYNHKCVRYCSVYLAIATECAGWYGYCVPHRCSCRYIVCSKGFNHMLPSFRLLAAAAVKTSIASCLIPFMTRHTDVARLGQDAVQFKKTYFLLPDLCRLRFASIWSCWGHVLKLLTDRMFWIWNTSIRICWIMFNPNACRCQSMRTFELCLGPALGPPWALCRIPDMPFSTLSIISHSFKNPIIACCCVRKMRYVIQ